MHSCTGEIYFIRAGETGPVKVGYSRDPQARLAALQTSHYERLCIVATVRGDLGLERALHAHFDTKSKHLGGEWFQLSDKDISETIGSILLGIFIYEPASESEAKKVNGELEFQYARARRLIIEVLNEAGDWLSAVVLEKAIIQSDISRRTVKGARAGLCREGKIQKRKIAEEWQWKIAEVVS